MTQTALLHFVSKKALQEILLHLISNLMLGYRYNRKDQWMFDILNGDITQTAQVKASDSTWILLIPANVLISDPMNMATHRRDFRAY